MPHFHDASEGTVQVNKEAVLPRLLKGATARAFGVPSLPPRYGYYGYKWCQWNTSVLLVPCSPHVNRNTFFDVGILFIM